MVQEHHAQERCMCTVCRHSVPVQCTGLQYFVHAQRAGGGVHAQGAEAPCTSMGCRHGAQEVCMQGVHGQGTDTGPGVTLNAPVAFAGGCGAMYEIHIESEEFREKRTVQQHRMVNQALSEEIKAMHGLRIFTSIPKA
uniref:BolA-like protein 3 n=3 Tax=Nothoprocta TaxID=8806 RepID=A0A8C6ZRG2_NOTPE